MLELFADLPEIKVPKYRRTYQITNFERPLDWRPREHLPELDGVYALDLETLDPGLTADKGSSWYKADEGFVTGIGVGDKHDQFYLPIAHSNGNVDPDRAWRWLAAQSVKPSVSFVYSNAPYDLGWLSKRHGVEFANAPYDVQAIAALLDETRFSYSLDTLGQHYLGRGKNDDDLIKACISGGLRDPMSRMDLVPAWLAEKYGLNDISLTIDLFHHLMPMIQRDGLAGVFELERECALVAVDMKALGVRVDLDRADQLRTDFKARRAAALAKIHELTGVHTSASDLQSLIRALKVEQPDVDLPTTAHGKESIAKGVLDALPSSPVIEAIREARELDKAVGTFIESYLFGHEYRGRIHADFNPLRRADEKGSGGATGGRWASQNPNLQNIPVRTKIGLEVRKCFVAEAGEMWAKFDYASQEPRLLIHFADITRLKGQPLKGAADMVRRFQENPLTDLHLQTALLMFGYTPETWEMLDKAMRKALRGRSKTINLAIAYGAGGGNICDQLGLPTVMKSFTKDGRTITYRAAGPEGQALLDRHFKAMPFLKQLQEIAKDRAEDKHMIRTISGRIIRFQSFGGQLLRPHKALNAVVQGSAADQMKAAQVAFRKEKIPLLVAVHDEGDFSVPRGADAYIARIKAIMEDVLPLRVPVVAEVKIGGNWGDVSVD
ncbi:MAG: DNA polymerase [Hyphomicrobium sp.]|jgi:DNA polymerase I-like protein with 3'-5' exonuclease and polymerase domains